MISIVWPDEADGADGVDPCLARGERMHQADDSGRSRHVPLHVLHPGSRLDRDAAGIEAHSLADEGDRGNAALAAVPAHDHGAALVLRALTNPEQGVHAELLHLRGVEDFDRNAELSQAAGAARELFRVEDIGRLIDKITREQNALSNRRARGKCLFRPRNVARRNRDLDLGSLLLIILALRLVSLERVSAQLNAERDVGGTLRLDGAPRQVGQESRARCRRRNAAHRGSAQLHEILGLEVPPLTDAEDDQAGHVEAGWRHDLEGRTALALETVGSRCAPQEVTGRLDRGAGRSA
jgi:hypothetical protein